MREHGVLRRALCIYAETAKKLRGGASTIDAGPNGGMMTNPPATIEALASRQSHGLSPIPGEVSCIPGGRRWDKWLRRALCPCGPPAIRS